MHPDKGVDNDSQGASDWGAAGLDLWLGGQRRQRQRAQCPEEARAEVPETVPRWSLFGCED
eukprot:7607841-Pyramimonas_sp.AAC.1